MLTLLLLCFCYEMSNSLGDSLDIEHLIFN